MNEILMLRGSESGRILQTALDKKMPAIMSYLSGGRWHLVRVLLTDIRADSFSIRLSPGKKFHTIDLESGQSVGISFKYGYGFGKFVFDTKIAGFERPSDDGGLIKLALPEQVELVQRRSYFRVKVPESLDVNVSMWEPGCIDGYGRVSVEHCWQGKLVDISAGGMQVAIASACRPVFRKGQAAGLRFTPLPYETPLMFNAYVKNVLPTAEDNNICFGLQMIGLEASPEGRMVLQRLCNVVEQYYQLSQSANED